jgi:sulfite reductase (ferredoxin)
VANGNIGSHTSRRLIEKLKDVIADDVRVTINQGLQFRFIKPEHLEYVYSVLDEEGFAAAGFGSVADVTSCPGTDTCNLGISNSTSTALALSEVIEEEFPEFLYNKELTIKISGCMNSCGQHGMASIGFHGSSLKAKGQILPALQVLIGGGVLGSGEGRIADKVLKVPSKRGPDVIRAVLNDYKTNATNGETFLNYSQRNGERYYYDLLKPLASLETLLAEDYIDWGQEEKFATAIGVGECAGVMIDLISTLIMEAEEKIAASEDCLSNSKWADGIYNAYAAQIHTAKALLLQQGVQCNTQHGILKDFDTHFSDKGLYIPGGFKTAVMYMNDVPPSEAFAYEYLQQAKRFIEFAKVFREQTVLAEK